MPNREPQRSRQALGTSPGDIWWFNANTKIGWVHLAITRAGVVRIRLPEKIHDRRQAPSNNLAPPPEILEMRSVVSRALERAHTHVVDLSTIPLVFSGTAFQKRVWHAIARVKPGQRTTYGALAKELENPGAARAVGSACGGNPFALIIPCHRVVAATGLGGFSGELAIKSALLAMEEGL